MSTLAKRPKLIDSDSDLIERIAELRRRNAELRETNFELSKSEELNWEKDLQIRQLQEAEFQMKADLQALSLDAENHKKIISSNESDMLSLRQTLLDQQMAQHDLLQQAEQKISNVLREKNNSIEKLNATEMELRLEILVGKSALDQALARHNESQKALEALRESFGESQRKIGQIADLNWEKDLEIERLRTLDHEKSKVIGPLEREVAVNQRLLQESAIKLESLQKSFNATQAELQLSITLQENKEKELISIRTEQDVLQRNLKETNETLAATRAQVNEYSTKHLRVQSELEIAQKKLESSIRELDVSIEERSRLEAALEKTQTDHTSQLAEVHRLNAVCAGHIEEKQTAAKHIERLESAANVTMAEQTAAESRIQELTEKSKKLHALEERFQILQTERHHLISKITAEQAALERLTKSFVSLQNQDRQNIKANDKLSSVLKQTKDELKNSQAQKAGLLIELDAASKAIQAKENQLGETKAELNLLNSKISEQEKTISQLKESEEKYLRDISHGELKLAAALSETETLNLAAQEQESWRKNAEQTHENLQSQIKAQVETISRLESLSEMHLAETASYEAKLNTARSEIESRSQTIDEKNLLLKNAEESRLQF